MIDKEFTSRNLFIVGCFLFIGLVSGNDDLKSKRCEPLKPPPNVLISCRNETNRWGRAEFTCAYSCKQHYIPHDQGGGSISAVANNPRQKIRCDAGGNWTNLQEFKRFTCREDCGKRVITGAKPLVINGVSTNTSAWPWHSIIFIKNNEGGWTYICGGSLIRDSVVLTAAHCLTVNTGKQMNPEVFRVVLGSISTNFKENQRFPNAQIFEVKQIYISPSYDTKDFEGDIGLMQLAGNGVRFSDHVIPVCLPNDGALDLNAVHSGRFGDVVGFGVDETGNVSMTLKHAELMVASQTECFASLKRIISIAQFCGGNRREDKKWVTVCNGDSGGGFFVPNTVRQRYSIHGIVSTGDLDSRRRYGICQKHVVFTRVFPYIFWIRDILERINGEIIRELASGLKYPYTQHGSESLFVHFTPIPRQWDNLVTSIHLSYTYVDPEVLFKSMEVNSGLEYLNMSHVKFAAQSFGDRRVTLPHLTSFVLDIQEFNCWKKGGSPPGGAIGSSRSQSDCIGVEPKELTAQKLKSLLFFDKYESDWGLDKLTWLGVNIDLTLHTYKIALVDVATGKLVLQFPFCSKILENINPDFKLRILALRSCELDLGILLQPQLALGSRSRSVLTNVHTLILDNVKFKEGALSELIRRMPNIENLAITGSEIDEQEELILELPALPLTLRHLTLTYVRLISQRQFSSLNDRIVTPSHSGNIVFPGDISTANRRSSSRLKPNLARLETFYCNSCTMDEEIIKEFPLIFHSAKKILFRGDQQLDVWKLLKEMTRLERIIFIDVEAEETQFINLDKVPPPPSGDWSNFIITKTNGRWRRNELKVRAELLLFVYAGGRNFWTSFEEFESDSRLTSFEKIAYTTGKYKFIGGTTTTRFAARAPRIPTAIRNNLKSVEIVNAEVVPNELLDSLNLAYDLESLILTKVRLLGYFVNFVQLPNLKKYQLNAISDSANFVDQTWSIYGVSFYIPFSQSNGQQQQQQNGAIRRYDNIPAPRGKFKMQSFDISFDDCKILKIDYKSGLYISTPRVGKNILPHLARTNLSSQIALRLSEDELNLLSIPANIQNLDLRCKSEYEWNCSRILTEHLHPLDSLTQLRMALHHVYEEHDFRKRSKFKLSDVSRSAATLQVLALEEAYLEFSPRIRFPALRTLMFDTCTFDPRILSHFFEIFPAVEEIGILSYGYDKYGPESKKQSISVNEKIVSELMENSRVKKIWANFGFSPDSAIQIDLDIATSITTKTEPKVKVQSKSQFYTQEKFREKLAKAGLKESEFHEFILVRNNRNQWEPIQDTKNKTMKQIFDQEIHVLRGDSTFGPPTCTKRLF